MPTGLVSVVRAHITLNQLGLCISLNHNIYMAADDPIPLLWPLTMLHTRVGPQCVLNKS